MRAKPLVRFARLNQHFRGGYFLKIVLFLAFDIWLLGFFNTFRRDTACRVRQFRERNNPLETFHRNVSKIAAQQAGHKGGAVLFAPPSKSCRFSHPPAPCAKSMAQGISLSADSDSGGASPPENLSPAALSWSSLMRSNSSDAFCFLRMRYHAPPIKTVLHRP